MDLSSLKPAKGSVKKGVRLGRGQGSGRGGTHQGDIKGEIAQATAKDRFGWPDAASEKSSKIWF